LAAVDDDGRAGDEAAAGIYFILVFSFLLERCAMF
jgi:hypothetical protein